MNSFHVSFPGLGIEGLSINRIAFTIHLLGREIAVYYYGIIIALAFLLAMGLSYRQAPYRDLSKEDLLDFYLALIPMSIVGARLYYVAFAWPDFKDNLKLIFNTRIGGMAFYGGVIGGILAILIMSKIKGKNAWQVLDYIAVFLPLGQAIGRWGNFFNQEAFGVNTLLPWGMKSEGTAAYLAQFPQTAIGYNPDLPVHPTFFYEFLANLLIFFALMIIKNKGKRQGTVLFSYLFSYGLVRYFVEGLRTDPLYLNGVSGIRVSQALSLVMVVVSFLSLIYIQFKKVKEEQTDQLAADLVGSLTKSFADQEGDSEPMTASDLAEDQQDSDSDTDDK